MEQSTTGGDYSLPLVHVSSPTAPCYYFRKTHSRTHDKHTDVHSETLLSVPVELPKHIFWCWINLWPWNKKQMCLPGGVAVLGVTCGQIISNKLCKSPQSSTGHRWIMLSTPSQWDYMNIFIEQQKAKESWRQAFPIPMKASPFVLMTCKADFWIPISGFFHADALYSQEGV